MKQQTRSDLMIAAVTLIGTAAISGTGFITKVLWGVEKHLEQHDIALATINQALGDLVKRIDDPK